MAFPEIGDRLRAYRLGSGLSIDDVAKRLRVSRSAIYRYEAGDVVKIETVQRIARLLNVSLAALLGVGIEHIPNALSFFERQRQLEAQARRMVVVFGPLAYLLTSDEYDHMLDAVIAEEATGGLGADRANALTDVLRSRKDAYRRTQSGIVNIISVHEIAAFLSRGLISARTRTDRSVIAAQRGFALREVGRLLRLIRKPPMGVQIGIVDQALPTTGFQVLFYDARPVVLSSPFRLGGDPNLDVGIASITNGDDAVRAYTQISDALWNNSLQGGDAAARVEQLLCETGWGAKRRWTIGGDEQ